MKRRSVPNDLAVLCRTDDGAYIVRDCGTGDVRKVCEVGRPLTAMEEHFCGEIAPCA